MIIRNRFARLENKENSRLPSFSVLEQDLEVGGHILPTGTVAVLCHMTMQHNPEVAKELCAHLILHYCKEFKSLKSSLPYDHAAQP